MKASISRMVVVKGVLSNCSDEHPGVINRVWSKEDTADGPVGINVTVFPDCGASLCKTSVMLYDSREAAELFLATQLHKPVVCFWPDRV